MLQEGVYPYEYMDNWKKFNETLLPQKEDFYSHLNIEAITDANYTHSNWGEYHGLHVQRVTLLLADIFENFRNMCLKIYETWSCKISLSNWISMEFCKSFQQIFLSG